MILLCGIVLSYALLKQHAGLHSIKNRGELSKATVGGVFEEYAARYTEYPASEVILCAGNLLHLGVRAPRRVKGGRHLIGEHYDFELGGHPKSPCAKGREWPKGGPARTSRRGRWFIAAVARCQLFSTEQVSESEWRDEKESQARRRPSPRRLRGFQF